MFRKYFNQMKLDELENTPFKSWECLTLCFTGGLEVNLVIKNEKAMENLLKLIIYKMKTVNGKKNTAK